MSQIRTAIVGVGNCAKSLVEGVALYYDAEDGDNIPGLSFTNIGGYLPGDIEFVVGFDVDERKVGKFLAAAIYSDPNNAMDILPNKDWSPKNNLFRVCGDAQVFPAPFFDGVAPHVVISDPSEFGIMPIDRHAYLSMQNDGHSEYVETDDIYSTTVETYASILREHEVDFLVNYLPVGSHGATRFWVDVCLRAKVAMVNCIPEFIASDPEYGAKFAEAGIPIIGDDMRSQFGASIVSAVLQDLLHKRGLTIDMHYQDNIGGNMDFYNMQDKERLSSKKVSKENVIRKQNELHGVDTPRNSITAGPVNFFEDLGDNKRAHWLIRARGFGNAPIEFTADLSVQDSPNSGGVVIDALRLLRVAYDIGIAGPVVGPSAWTQKTPPIDMDPGHAYEEVASMAKINAETPEDEVVSLLEEFGYVEDGDFFVHESILSGVDDE